MFCRMQQAAEVSTGAVFTSEMSLKINQIPFRFQAKNLLPCSAEDSEVVLKH